MYVSSSPTVSSHDVMKGNGPWRAASLRKSAVHRGHRERHASERGCFRRKGEEKRRGNLSIVRARASDDREGGDVAATKTATATHTPPTGNGPGTRSISALGLL